MATLTFSDNNGMFSSWLMIWQQLTHVDIYTLGSSAPNTLIGSSLISPVLIGY